METNSGEKPKRLLGRDEATIDDKGRILFAKKKRDRLGDDFVMCLGDNGCLYAYPAEVWEALMEDVLSYDPTNQGRQTYTRLVLGTAEDELNFDGQGRAVVPRKLREMAKLRDRIVLIGCGDRLEIWDADELAAMEANPRGYCHERMESIRKAREEMKQERLAAL